jgi:hypothetical protein
MENKKSVYLIVVFFGLFVLGISVNEVISKYKFNTRAILTEATVIESDLYKVAKSTSIQQKVSFLTVEGKLDTVILRDIHNKYLPGGSRIQVYYAPENPDYVSTGKMTNNYIGVVIGGLLFIYALSNYRNERIKEKANKPRKNLT